MSRRTFLRRVGIGAGAVTVVAIGGGGWRIVDQRILAPGTGPAYDAWRARLTGDGPSSLVRTAVLAPNAHDTQPWAFIAANDRIELFADRTRTMGALDPLGRELEISLGCALENLVLAAAPNGYRATVEVVPTPGDPEHVATVALSPATVEADPLFAAIPERRTNRAAYATDRTVDQATLEALAAAAGDGEASVAWLTAADQDEFGRLTVDATTAIIGNEELARADIAWYRQGWAEIQRRKDGITLDAAGLDELLRVLVRFLPPGSAAQLQQGWLDATRDRHVATAAAIGLIVVGDGQSPAARIAAGRALERVWLAATARGLAVQPLNQVFEMADHEATGNATMAFGAALTELVPGGGQAVTAFRMGWPTATPYLAPRRPAEEVLRA